MTRRLAVSAIFILGGVAAFAVSFSCGPCDGGVASCFGPELFITSPANDLVSAAGCGRSATCNPSPCGTLYVSPPVDGGVCVTTVAFADGTTTNVTFDWGAAHPGQCCGTSYDNQAPLVTLHGDASTD